VRRRRGWYERRHSSDILLQLFQFLRSVWRVQRKKIARMPDQELPALCNNSHYESLRSRMHRTSVGNRPLRRCGVVSAVGPRRRSDETDLLMSRALREIVPAWCVLTRVYPTVGSGVEVRGLPGCGSLYFERCVRSLSGRSSLNGFTAYLTEDAVTPRATFPRTCRTAACRHIQVRQNTSLSTAIVHSSSTAQRHVALKDGLMTLAISASSSSNPATFGYMYVCPCAPRRARGDALQSERSAR
jgi:hypothetical protein